MSEMFDTPHMLWCYVEGDNAVFRVIISSTKTIDDLKRLIKEKRSNLLQGIDASSLTLMKVRYIMISM
jgi:hypothetical protein